MSVFDLSDPMTRVLTCSGLVAGGAVVAAVAPVGLAAGAALTLGGLASDILASDLHNETLGRLGKSGDLLKNHDLTKLTGAAVHHSLQKFADSEKHSFSRKEKKAIRSLGKFLESRWEGLAEKPEWEAGVQLVQGCEIGNLLATEESALETTALEPDAWQTLLRAHAEMGKIELSEETRLLGAEHLHLHFSHAVWELLKEDAVGKGPSGGRAYAALQMTMLGAIQSRLPSAVERDAQNTKLADQLREVTAEKFEQLREELDEAAKERHAELIEWFETILEYVIARFVVLQETVNNLANDEARRHEEVMAILNKLPLANPDPEPQAENQDLRKQLEKAKAALLTLASEAKKGNQHAEVALASEDPEKVQFALMALREEETEEAPELDRQIATIAFLRGDIDEAKRRLKNILSERPDDLDAINRTGLIHKLQGDLPSAEASYKRLLELANDDPGVHATAYVNLGLIYETQGDLGQAETMHKKSLALYEKLGRKEGIANQYSNLGLIYRTRGDLGQAEAIHKKSLALFEELGRKEEMANQYSNLGLIYRTRGDLGQAEAIHKKSLALFEELGRKEGMANQYSNLGLIYRMRGDLDQAEAVHNIALAIDEELGRKEGMASDYGNLGLIYETRGDLDEARRVWTKSLDLFTEIGIPYRVEFVQELLDALSP